MVFYCNNDCFVHFIADNLTRTGLSKISFHGNFSFLSICAL